MPFRICSTNNKILIFHLTFCDAIKANPGLKCKNTACEWLCEGTKNADMMSDDQFHKQASRQIVKDRSTFFKTFTPAQTSL